MTATPAMPFFIPRATKRSPETRPFDAFRVNQASFRGGSLSSKQEGCNSRALPFRKLFDVLLLMDKGA